MFADFKSKIEKAFSSTRAKLFTAAFVGFAALLYLLASNVAYAVSVNGEFVGYAGTVDEITSAMDSVTATASGALGYEYTLESDVSYELSLGRPDEKIASVVEEKLLDDIDSIGKYSIVCVNGVPFCAFESTEAASAAGKAAGHLGNRDQRNIIIHFDGIADYSINIYQFANPIKGSV